MLYQLAVQKQAQIQERRSSSIVTKVCTEVNISILKQKKMTFWDLGEEI